MNGSQISGEYNIGEDQNMANNRRYGEIEEIIDDLERAFEKFENFEILNDAPSDHCFLFKGMTNKSNSRRRNLIEKVKLEWEVLRVYLTKSSIYVRAYEQRPDLMRAIIVGPEGTIHHHALFCFDIRFPSNYPAQPPELSYRSYDPSSNPNSNTNGKFEGFSNLKMKSHSAPATMLGLLTLIQNSFLHNKPNDALRLPSNGEGPNVRVMKQTWKAMLCMLKSPPQNFEVFVRGYFRTRAHQILMNFKSRISLDITTIGLFSELIRAFEANGTYCKHHCNKEYFDLVVLLKGMRPQQKPPSAGIVKKLSTIFQGVFF